jgi:hypothetical protein
MAFTEGNMLSMPKMATHWFSAYSNVRNGDRRLQEVHVRMGERRYGREKPQCGEGRVEEGRESHAVGGRVGGWWYV